MRGQAYMQVSMNCFAFPLNPRAHMRIVSSLPYRRKYVCVYYGCVRTAAMLPIRRLRHLQLYSAQKKGLSSTTLQNTGSSNCVHVPHAMVYACIQTLYIFFKELSRSTVSGWQSATWWAPTRFFTLKKNCSSLFLFIAIDFYIL